MNVTCPECSAKYKIDESKIQGRGAKITCPKCSHKFVVNKESETPSGSDIARRDFTKFGIRWKVRKPIGMTYEFTSLGAIRQAIADRQIDTTDLLSYDGLEWTPLNEIGEVEKYFENIWAKAEAGEIKGAPSPAPRKADLEDEDDSDAPTTIVKLGSSLSDEIRRAVADASTPVPEPPSNAPNAISPGAPKPTVPAPAPAPAKQPDPFSQAKPAETGGNNALMYAGVGVLFVVLLGAALWFSGVLGS